MAAHYVGILGRQKQLPDFREIDLKGQTTLAFLQRMGAKGIRPRHKGSGVIRPDIRSWNQSVPKHTRLNRNVAWSRDLVVLAVQQDYTIGEQILIRFL